MRFNRPKLLLLDVDGTLAAIAKTPHSVVLSNKTKDALRNLARLPHIQIVVISGRSIGDLRKLLSLNKIIYVGNHGLELQGIKKRLPKEAVRARRCVRVMKHLARKLKADFYFWPGILVEDKKFTLSVHYRLLPVGRWPAFNELIRFYIEKYKSYPVIWRKGKRVWEVCPKEGFDKGSATLYLAGLFSEAQVIAIGDDKTDEDMFRVMKRQGITIRVGYSRKSIAQYYFKSTEEVREFLKKIPISEA